MAAQKEWASLIRQMLFGGVRDAGLGAARVGDESMRRSVARKFRKKVDGRRNRQSDVDEVGTLQRCGEFAVERRIDGASCVSFTNDVVAVPAGNTEVRSVLA